MSPAPYSHHSRRLNGVLAGFQHILRLPQGTYGKVTALSMDIPHVGVGHDLQEGCPGPVEVYG